MLLEKCIKRLLCLCFFSGMWGRWVQKEQFGCYSACFRFRYFNTACFVLRRRCIMFDSHCLSTCVCYERRDGLFLPSQSKQWLFDQLVRRALRHTSWTPTHTDTHLPGRESVLWKHAYDLTLAVSLPLCLQNPMGLIWYHNRVCLCLWLGRKLKGNTSLSVVWFFFAQSPQIPQISLRSPLLSRVTTTSRACLSLKRGHKPRPGFKLDVLVLKPRLAD